MPAYQTLSDAFLKSIKLRNRSRVMLWVLLYDDSTIEGLFYFAPAWFLPSNLLVLLPVIPQT